MRLPGRGIDEYTLAAYLSGRLGPTRRHQVAEFLAENSEARDLLVAANQLLESEGDGDARSVGGMSAVSLPPRKRPLLRGDRRLGVLFWTTLVVVGLTAFATTSFIAVRVGMDVGSRSIPTAAVDPDWWLEVQGPFEGIAWDAVPDVDRYRVMFWDEAQSGLLGQIEAAVPYLDYQDIGPHLQPIASRRIWIDALDAEGHLIKRSRSIQLRDGPSE
jgi:hypothetical protein